MRFMVIALKSGEVLGAVTRTKKQAFDWRNETVAADDAVAWRYHDGSGWADGSPDAWQHIMALPSRVALEIYR